MDIASFSALHSVFASTSSADSGPTGSSEVRWKSCGQELHGYAKTNKTNKTNKNKGGPDVRRISFIIYTFRIKKSTLITFIATRIFYIPCIPKIP